MSDALSLFAALRRPRLLIRAARLGLTDYRRERDLRRLLRRSVAPSPAQALPDLIEVEAELESLRHLGDGSYSIARHVEILIAMMAEARMITASNA